ncbi:MAG: ABC transporter permease [Rhizobiales bacterium]|nr:ABC transporter permease [Hyphomicrobiales bacterium]
MSQNQSAEAAIAVPESRPRLTPLAGLLDIERFGLIYVWLLLIAGYSLFVPSFFSVSTFQIVLGSQATQIVITLAVVVALLGGEFDLSVANVMAVAATAVVTLNTDYAWPIGWTILAVIAAALAFGALNAFISVRIGVPSIITTLGSGTLLMGAANGWAGSAPRAGVDQRLIDLVSLDLLGAPLAIYVTFAIGIGIYYVLEHTPAGRAFVFSGQNAEVARLAGIRVARMRSASLIWSSLLSSVAGILLVGITGASVPAVASGYLLPAFAGAFLGSTVIRPGRFNVAGVFIAIYFLVTGVTGLQLLGYTGWVNDVFYGFSLVLAVVLTQLIAKSRRSSGARAP